MAGIFNLFGGISNHDKDQVVKPLSRSKTSLGVNGTSIKTLSQSKSKGLSIRSNSDSNVSATVCLNNQDVFNKKQECLKQKLTQLDRNGCSSSLRKELTAKKLNEHPNKIKDLSPRKVIFNPKTVKLQKISDDYIFKKPLSPKKLITKSYPEPENLAPYYDMQYEFDHIYTKTMENKLKELSMKKNEVLTYEDEEFESDPEPFKLELSKLCILFELFEEEYEKCCTPDLPEISDDDDDDRF
ncbi:uncharacterized protein LOC143144041 [Ptiloglossa arizonensis]|uniref:uncharacterized protein LOC143144041 n=1 Tax=Ptiloglossa arizonensis TaxID=3350558 RepID=UPI003FA16792